MQAKSNKCTEVFGQIVREYRLKSGKTIYKISAEAGIPKTTWRRIEIGFQKDICLSSIWKIADGLEIYPEILIKELRIRLGEDFNFIDE